jgi:4-hydroxy-tetrahydrodipicolinate reductase
MNVERPLPSPIKVCLAGATGWAGSELARSIAKTGDVALVAAVSRKHAGRSLGEVLDEPLLACSIYVTAAEALAQPCDVFVEYTKPDSAKGNILAALGHGAHVVVGTSGLTEDDFTEIDAVARRQRRGVLACGNFALTVEALVPMSTARCSPSAKCRRSSACTADWTPCSISETTRTRRRTHDS